MRPPINEQNTWYQNVLFVLITIFAYLILWPFLLADYLKNRKEK